VRRPSSAHLVAREAELDRLDRSFRMTATDGLGLVLLGGEAGVGKSRLVAEHLRRVDRDGGWTLLGECLQVGGTSLPYGPFVDALSRSTPAALRAREMVDWSDPRPDRRRRRPGVDAGYDALAAQATLFAEVAAALESLAVERPLLLAIEDLHWADPASRDLLAYLVRRLRDSPIQVVASFRTDSPQRHLALGSFLAEASRWRSTDILSLDRLGRAETETLIGALIERPLPRSTVDRLFERSEGNPFFLEALIAGMDDADEPGGATVLQVLGVELAELSADAREVLGTAAALGQRSVHDQLVEIVDLPERSLIAAIRECVEARILIPVAAADHAAYQFRHALLREVAYGILLPAERVRVHRRAAAALAVGIDLAGDIPVDLASAIAYHADRARELPLALAAADAAGRAASAALAFADADRYFSLALSLWDEVRGPGHERELATLLGRAANAAAYANEPARAVDHQRRRIGLLADAPAEAIASMLHRLFWYLWDAGRTDELLEVATRQVELLDGAPTTTWRADALADLGFAHWTFCENAAAEALASQAAAIAREVGDDAVEGTALHVLAMATAGLGRTAAADPIFARAADLLRRTGDADGLSRTAHWWANTLELDGSYERGVEIARAGLRDARSAGVDMRHGDSIRAVLAENLENMGRWAEALEVSAGGFNWGSLQPTEIWSHAVHARIQLARGQIDGAAVHLDAAERVPATGPDRVWQLEELMALAYAVGDAGRARRYLDEALGAVSDPLHESAIWILLARALDAEVEACLAWEAKGDPGLAAMARARAEDCAARIEASAEAAMATGGEGPLIRAFRVWAGAQCSRLAGAPDPRLWSEAVAARDALPQPYDAARGRVLWAEALLAAHADAGAIDEVLGPARVTAESLEVPPLMEAIERVAAAAGAARVPGVGSVRGVVGLPIGRGPDISVLSARELEVLALVAAGRTNREIGETLFISPKTASVHVTHILDKLGVDSRVEAALLGARLGLIAGAGAEADAGAPGGVGGAWGGADQSAPAPILLSRQPPVSSGRSGLT
jgi:DNA-binding CsgD family transcriptional regulator